MKFEYTAIRFSRFELNDHLDRLNTLGAEGWECFDSNYDTQCYVYLLKREKIDPWPDLPRPTADDKLLRSATT